MKAKEIDGLDRFVLAQEKDYETALTEISYGRKKTHWMWYVFPQIKGLGFSDIAQYYSIKDLNEAKDYYAHPVLGSRLVTITRELLHHSGKTAFEIFGSPDDLKLRSCMTLFAAVPGADLVFLKIVDQFFNGELDPKTQRILDMLAY